MNKVNKVLAAFALIAGTLAAGVFVVRNASVFTDKRPAVATVAPPGSVAGVPQSSPPAPLAAPPINMAEAGFDPLFNGRDLTGWTGDTSRYSVENGVLAYNGPGRANVSTIRDFANFQLRFDYKVTGGADSGIGFRAPSMADPKVVVLEVQLQDESGQSSTSKIMSARFQRDV
jgi:hypothetical protein